MRIECRLLCLLIIATIATATSAAAQPVANPTSQFFTTTDGVKIHYMTLGDAGSWVVLIHGFADTADRMWFRSGVAAALARNHRVVALDNRNHGKSDAPEPDGPGRPQDVIELMDHLKIERAHVHGYSMGGGFTAWILATHPQRLLSAALGGSGIFETDEKLATQASALDKPVPPLTSDLGGSSAPSPDSATLKPAGNSLTVAQLARLKRLIEVSAARMKSLPALRSTWLTSGFRSLRLRANSIDRLGALSGCGASCAISAASSLWARTI